jgi:hypothetical protein
MLLLATSISGSMLTWALQTTSLKKVCLDLITSYEFRQINLIGSQITEVIERMATDARLLEACRITQSVNPRPTSFASLPFRPLFPLKFKLSIVQNSTSTSTTQTMTL